MAKLDARKSGSFRIGGDIEVHRLGFRVMRIAGPRIWGPIAALGLTISAQRVVSRWWSVIALRSVVIGTAKQAYGPSALLGSVARSS